MCGDSTSPTDVNTLMNGELADMVWTDPPYNVAVDGQAGTILNDDMDSRAFRSFVQGFYASLQQAMRPGAVIYLSHGESERAAFTDCMLEAGFKLAEVLIWVKGHATFSRQDFNWQHEPILYGWKEGAGHYFCGDFTRTTVIDNETDLTKMTKDQLVELAKELSGNTSIIRHPRPTKSELHPTMKPVALIERMISWSSKPNWLILDLFGGSGSTLIAAHAQSRRANLMELDPKFCDVICTRFQTLTGIKPIAASTGNEHDFIKGK
jgi:DNA modification methylase